MKHKIKESISSKKIVQSLLNCNGEAGIELVSLNTNEQYISLTKKILIDGYDELVKTASIHSLLLPSKHPILLQKFVPHNFLEKIIQQLNKNKLVQQGYFVDNQHQEEFDKLVLDVFESELAICRNTYGGKVET